MAASFYTFPANSSGYAYSTYFAFVNTTTTTRYPIKQYVWDLGDGNFEYFNKNQTLFHIYKYPGTYTVSLTAYDIYGGSTTYSKSVYVEYLYRDYIEIIQYPESFGTPGNLTTQPFKVLVVSSQINEPVYVQLFADNSLSTPYNFASNKWKFLTPTWYFTDMDGNITEQILIDTVPIYDKNNRQVAVSGIGTFYFKDDLSTGDPTTNCPLVLVTTLQTSGFAAPLESNVYSYPSYSNTTVSYATIAWQVQSLSPNYLRVTGNYIDEVSPCKWENKPIPVTISLHNNLANQYNYTGVPQTSSGILFNYPPTNSIGKLYNFSLSAKDSMGNFIPCEFDTTQCFQAVNASNQNIGGYIYTTITPLATATNVRLHATADIQLSSSSLSANPDVNVYPENCNAMPVGWIVNADDDNLIKVTSVPYPANCTNINTYKKNGTFIDTTFSVSNTPCNANTNITPLYENYLGAYSVSVFPNDNSVVVTNARSNNLFKYTTGGKLISSVSLSSIIPECSGTNPAYTSIDQNGNIWMSLYNSVSVLKLDYNFNLMTVTEPISATETLVSNLQTPVIIETTRSNNCWAIYNSSSTSQLVKYQPNGDIISQIELGDNCTPVGIAINKRRQLWLLDTYTLDVTGKAGRLRLFETDNTLLSCITGFNASSYICLDMNNNVWFTHGVRNLGYVDCRTGTLSSWYVQPGAAPDSSNNILLTFNNINTFSTDATNNYFNTGLNTVSANSGIHELGGIASDAYNRIWLVDSTSNNLFVIPAMPKNKPNNIKSVLITPTSSTEKYKPLQSFGDWTGNRWLAKYARFTTYQAKGRSKTFNINKFEDSFNVCKVNQNFNMAKYFQSLALPEVLSQNVNLFEPFLGAVAGNAEMSNTPDIGQEIYEKIANFTNNHADVDTCSIDQLLSLANMLDIPAANFSTLYPAGIKDMLNLTSIPKTKLWGTVNPQPVNNTTLDASYKNQLNTLTDFVTAGKKLFLRNKLNTNLELITVPLGPNNEKIYPLSSYPADGLSVPVYENYLFYRYTPKYASLPTNGIIDWSNPLTTLNKNLSTTEDLYKDNGVVETMFNYLLTKNLIF